VASVMSFSSNSAGLDGTSVELQGHRRLGAKVDVVYNLLGMLEKNGREDMSTTLLSMSASIDSCLVMRQSGCLPLLVQLIHAPGQNPDTRHRAMQALHNVIHAKSDERAGRREARVLRFLEQLRDYCQTLRMSLVTGQTAEDLERGHPAATIAALMKLSFDEAHRHAMCQLGGLHAVAELIEMDHLAHGSESDDQNCITLRRYAGMALTNLTFGDGNNKALLCSFREFMKALVSQLQSPSDDLRQVTASVLRNLSWRADNSSKQTLREVGAVTGLMRAAMEGRKESTLKSILSALWNLSAHCSTNKVDICAVDGALAFLVDMLSYKAPSKTLAIIENAGGILRNVSSHVAVREDYRAIVRERGCLQVLLQQLRSPSLTVVSNACGALWNLSARCPQDQRLLWDLGAVPMLRSLVHSKHKMISMGSSAALKNLLSARPGCNNLVHLDSTARGLGLSTLPSLIARRQRALEQEIDQNLAETCDNIEPSTSPTNKDDHRFTFKLDHSFLGVSPHGLRAYQSHSQQQPSTSAAGTSKCNGVARSESRDSMRSITSTHSDTMFERVNRHVLNGMSPTDPQIKQQSSSLHSAVGFDSADGHTRAISSERKYTLRYKNAIPERLRPTEGFDELRCTNSTISWAAAPNQEPSQISLHSSIENNVSLIEQSISSSSKTGSQSSVSEDAEATVCTKADYRRTTLKATINGTKSYLPDVSPMKENAGFSNVFGNEKILLRQHDALDSIQKAISPTIGRNPDGTVLFGDYAETDLDQPTDYSLRYGEHYGEQTTDDEKQHSSGFFSANDQGLLHEDTVRTYYTEGTPRGVSLNSSRATSASDLQEDSRVRNSSRKLPERYKVRHMEDHGEETSSLTNISKQADFTESEMELNLQGATHLTDDEGANHSLPYLEKDLNKQLKSVRKERKVQNFSR
jgi:adenomatosis polyposis coli protein